MTLIPNSSSLIFEKIASVIFLILIAIDFASLVQFPLFFTSPSFKKNQLDLDASEKVKNQLKDDKEAKNLLPFKDDQEEEKM